MAKVCDLTGKSKDFGSQRSHSMRQTRKLRDSNLQKIRVFDGGNMRTLKVASSTIRSLYKSDQKLLKKVNKK